MKIWKADTGSSVDKCAAGEVISADEDGITVKCGEGVLIIKELQMPGKKRVSVKDFLLGHKIEEGTILS